MDEFNTYSSMDDFLEIYGHVCIDMVHLFLKKF